MSGGEDDGGGRGLGEIRVDTFVGEFKAVVGADGWVLVAIGVGLFLDLWNGVHGFVAAAVATVLGLMHLAAAITMHYDPGAWKRLVGGDSRDEEEGGA